MNNPNNTKSGYNKHLMPNKSISFMLIYLAHLGGYHRTNPYTYRYNRTWRTCTRVKKVWRTQGTPKKIFYNQVV